jgi:hypothetical protein
MQTKVTVAVAMGFVMGLGLASCASVDSGRTIASDSSPHFAKSAEGQKDKIECNVGEERNETGDCERPHEFDRPFHRGGR